MSTPRLLASALLLAGCRAPASRPPPSPTGMAFLEAYAPTSTAPEQPATEEEAAEFEHALLEQEVAARFSLEAEAADLVSLAPARLEELLVVASREELAATALEGPLHLEELTALVWLRHPGVEAGRRQLAAALRQFEQARYLEAVAAEYRAFLRQLENRVGPRPPGRRSEAIHPYPSTVALRGEWVAADAGIAWQQLRRTIREVVVATWRAAAEWHFLQRSATITGEQIAIFDQLEPVVRSQVESTVGSVADLLAVHAEVHRLSTTLENLHDEQGEVRARLNALLHRPPDAALPARLVEPFPTLREPDPDAARRRALEQRAELHEQAAVLRRSAAAIRLAELMSLPRPVSGSALLQRGTSGEASVAREGGLFGPPQPLPAGAWSGTREALVLELRERQEQARARLEELRDSVGLEIEQALVSWRTAQREEQLYRVELVPLAERGLESVRASYDGNRARFIDVLEAARRVWNARHGLARAERDLRVAGAGLMDALGADPRLEQDG